MSDYLWAIFAIVAAIGQAGMFYVSEYYKQGGIAFIVIIRILTALYMLPVVMFLPWPDSPLFYLYTAISILIVPFLDIIYFRISANYGAGLLTRITPILTVFLFIGWIIIDHNLLEAYLENLPLLCGIVFSILGLTISVAMLRKCSITMQSLKMCLPVFVVAPVSGICAKLAFDQTDISTASFTALFLLSAGTIPIYFLVRLFSHQVRKESVIKKQVFKAAFIASIFSAILIVSINYSVDLAPNPAYTRSLAFTSGFWILIFYWMIGRKEEARVIEGCAIIFFAMLLVFLSAQV